MATKTVYNQASLADLERAIAFKVDQVQITDIHTHLYAPAFGELLLWGIDELLTYHYLIAEFFRLSDMPYDEFWALDKKGQADVIWQTLFVDNSPFSESCRGVLTALQGLGLDTETRDLDTYRKWYGEQTPEGIVDKVFEAARIKCAVMTNDPFDTLERPAWDSGIFIENDRFPAALRIDPLLNDWPHTYKKLKDVGYKVDDRLSSNSLAQVRNFLRDWATKMKALYMAVSLPPEFMLPEDSLRGKLIEHCVIPVCRELNIPFAMMIGVTRNVNPQLKLAGDGVGTGSLDPVEYLCAKYPKNKFMLTMLSRENQHACCITARKFRNLLLFGCWWFLNDPSLIEEITRMRFELLGPSIIPQHSDARVLDQVIYKWNHSRQIITKVLVDKYTDLVNTGWTVTDEELDRDIENQFGGNFWKFLERKL